MASLLKDEVRATLVHSAGGTIVALLAEGGDEVETHIQTLCLSECSAGNDITYDLGDQGAQEHYQQDEPDIASCQIGGSLSQGIRHSMCRA